MILLEIRVSNYFVQEENKMTSKECTRLRYKKT